MSGAARQTWSNSRSRSLAHSETSPRGRSCSPEQYLDVRIRGMADPKEPAPSSPLPQGAPFSMPSPFPAPAPEPEPTPPTRGRKAVWTVVGLLLVAAAKYFLASQGVPAPLVDEAAQQIQHALPR
jgi:hypothetical protein